MGERAINEQIALVVQKLWRHGGKLAAVKQVQEKCRQNVVAMMAQHHGAAPFLACDAVKVAAAQARAKRAIGPTLRHLIHDDGIGVGIFDAVDHTHTGQKIGQNRRRKARLPLIEIAGQQIDGQKPAPLQFGQRGKQGIAVLATRQADQPFLTRGGWVAVDHGVAVDRLAGFADDALAQLAEFGGFGCAMKQRVDIVRLGQAIVLDIVAVEHHHLLSCVAGHMAGAGGPSSAAQSGTLSMPDPPQG